MTETVLALVVGAAVSLGWVCWMYTRLLEDHKDISASKLDLALDQAMVEGERREWAETKARDLQSRLDAQKDAIEANALPWVARNDTMEARFEAEAMDKLNNPQVSWDSIPGLGGTK